MSALITYLIIAVVILTAGFLAFLLFRRSGLSSLNLKLLLVEIPEDEKDQNQDIVKEINKTEQLFSSLVATGSPFFFETAVHHNGEAIHFYVAVPGDQVEFTARQIQGLFPNARVEEAKDYNIFTPGGSSAGAYLKLKDYYALPIRTYEERASDSFAQVLSTLSTLRDVGEGAAVQVSVSPAPKWADKSVSKAVDFLRRGGKLKDLLKAKSASIDLPKKEEDKPMPLVDEEAVKAVSSKISKPIFSVNIRIVTASEDEERAKNILMALSGAYKQFTAPGRNDIEVIKPKKLKKLLYLFTFRETDDDSMILNTAELASLFHLPGPLTEVPNIKWLNTKEAPPPENLPSEGVILGESIFRGNAKLVRMQDDDRRRHLYVIGQTGTGKSYSMLSSVVQDMEAGKGLCVIDPHGELVDDILERVPKHRIDDVIVFDPGDIERPLGLNMLEFDPSRPEQKTFIVNEMQSIFNRLFSKETMGPMFEQYMRNTLLLLMDDTDDPSTLVEVPRVFTDSAFRERKLAKCKNPTVIDFWTKEAVKTTGEGSLANMSPYITTKFGNFISNDYVRPIIGQTKSAFNFRDVMDNNKILLVNLSKGRIGDINANLLGMVITGRILMAALSRAEDAKEDRKDFYFYIDEFQNFTTDSIAVILSEARKYKLNLILAHQFIDQLTDEIREAVFGNVGSMMAFRVGVPDTEELVKQFSPEFNEKDLISIENRRAFVRLLINGEPSKPFSIHTRLVPKGSTEVRDKLKELSRLSFGQTKAEIEAQIIKRLRE